MRVLVTGSNGLLGSKVLAALVQRTDMTPIATSRAPCANHALGAFSFHRLDVTDAEQTRRLLDETRPDVVIHTAAMTDVDGCERDPEAAWRLNVQGTVAVAEAAARIGAGVVHLSTEYVFDGTAGPYAEDDPPHPISVYGRTKLESERALAARCPRWTVARTTVLFGYAPSARPNFVLWLLDRLARGEHVRVVADQIGSPTLADNLAEMVLALGANDVHGIYHTVGASRLSRHAFAQLAARTFGLEEDLIEPITTAELRQPALRPLAAGLLTHRLERDFPTLPVLTAEAALERLRSQLAAAEALPIPPAGR